MYLLSKIKFLDPTSLDSNGQTTSARTAQEAIVHNVLGVQVSASAGHEAHGRINLDGLGAAHYVRQVMGSAVPS